MEAIEILYEDKQILVCRKRAGVAVQSARIGQMDMESALKNYLQGGFVGIVQRLDQPVEGVLVFGKTREAAAELNRQQQNGKMKKTYLAVYIGEAEQMEGTLTDILLKDGRTNTSRVVAEGTPQGKRAVLDYRILRQQEGLGLAQIQLHTGRHHQIRVQMSSHGMPLWGDGKYNPQADHQKRGGQGIGLCAWRLEFLHPKTKKKMEFQIKPEGEIFKKLLD